MKKETFEQSTAAPTTHALVSATILPTATEDKSLTIKSTALAGQALQSVTSLTGGHAKVTLNKTTGNITFTPDADFSGIASFQYVLADGTVHTANIDVAPVADAPKLSVSTPGNSGAATRVGGETQVNTTEAGGQFLSEVASFANGDYVIVWSDTSFNGLAGQPRTDFTQIRGQFFHKDGTKVGGEFQVSSDRTVGQNNPKVAVLDNGSFAVTWQTEGASAVGDTDGTGIKGQVFSVDGAHTPARVGSEFQVNSTTAGDQLTTSVAGLGNGRFVVTWQDDSAEGPDVGNIKMRIFQNTGTGTPVEVVPEFTANSVTLGAQQLPSVAALHGAHEGSYVAVWTDYGVDGQHSTRGDGSFSGTVIARMFDQNGNPLSNELVVNVKGVDKFNDVAHVVGLANGGFAVAWEAGEQVDPSTQIGPDTEDSSVHMRIFNAQGQPTSGEIQVNTTGDEYQRDPRIVELSNGNFAIVWKDESQTGADTTDYAVRAQILDANGNKLGSEFVVNTITAGGEQMQDIAALPNGGFVVTWTDDSGLGHDTQDDAVKQQIFTFGNTPLNAAVKLNVSASTADKDGSETLAVSVSNLLAGSVLTDGVHSVTATATQTTADITGWNFNNLTVTPPPGFTGDLKLTITATATDHATLSTGVVNSAPKSVSQTVDIIVQPLTGTITDASLSNASVAENAAQGTVVGTVQGADTLPGAVLTYSLINNDNGAFAINASTGVITVANGGLLDFESSTKHAVGVQITDQSGASLVKTFNISLTNVNEAPTNETLTGGSVAGNAPVGTVVGTVKGIDPDAGSVLSYAFGVNADGSPANAGGAFAIDASSGIITVADSSKLDFATGASRAIDVRVTDQGGLSFDKAFNITVVNPAAQIVAANEHRNDTEDNPVVISAASLINDSTNPSGAALSVTSVGKAQHGTVSVAKDANGNITSVSFLPNANFSGTDSFTYTLSDSSGHSSTATVSIDVAPVADAPALSFSTTGGGSGAVVRVGGETQVNTTTAGGQFLSSVASYANGNYVVVWADTSYEGLGSAPRTDFTQIRGQFYDKNGNKVGGEFQVSSDRSVGQNNPKVSVLDNGDFAVVWQTEGASATGDTNGSGVKAQVFSADGAHTPARVGSEFQVNSTTAGDQLTTSLAGLGNGRFVVTWQDDSTEGTDGGNIKMRIFQDTGTGTPVEVVPEFTANRVTLGAQQLPSVAALEGVNNGSYVAVWTDYGVAGQHSTRGDGSFSGTVIARMFDKNGNPLSDELVVNARNVEKFSDVAHVTGLRNGGFVVAWEAGEQVDPSTQIGPDTDDSSIHMQRFNADGSKAGGEIQVNTTGDEYQRDPRIVELTNGDLAVVWKDESQTDPDPTDYAVRAQILDANGNKLGSEFVVNTITAGGEQMQDIAALPNNGFIVTWTDDSGTDGIDSSDDAVKQQIFTVAGVTPGTAVKVNLAAQLTDTDGSESLTVSISNLPPGAVLTDGTVAHTFKASDGHGTVDVTGWSLANLTVTPPAGFTGDFKLTANATSVDHATLSTGAVTSQPNTVSQTIDFVVAPDTSGGTGNDVLVGGSGNDVLTGGGGNDTYQFARGGGQDRIVNGTTASTTPGGELDFGPDIGANQLWFQQNGNDLSIAIMGTHDQITVAGWFSRAGSQLADIKTDDGKTIDVGVSQLVQAMASYTSTHAGFDPTTVQQAPSDTGLQTAIAASWHS